ncbi:conserved hypothetical protein [Desulfarculales bacterium]
MDASPLWTRCLYLRAGTCPQIIMEFGLLSGQDTPRPELTQDLALTRLALACQTCYLAPTDIPKT